MYDTVIKEGTILRTKWGHRGRDADFHQVVRHCGTHVIIREIDSKPGAGGAGAVPCRDGFIAGAIRRKIRHYHGREFVVIDGLGGGDRALIWEEPPREAAPVLRFVGE